MSFVADATLSVCANRAQADSFISLSLAAHIRFFVCAHWRLVDRRWSSCASWSSFCSLQHQLQSPERSPHKNGEHSNGSLMTIIKSVSYLSAQPYFSIAGGPITAIYLPHCWKEPLKEAEIRLLWPTKDSPREHSQRLHLCLDETLGGRDKLCCLFLSPTDRRPQRNATRATRTKSDRFIKSWPAVGVSSEQQSFRWSIIR